MNVLHILIIVLVLALLFGGVGIHTGYWGGPAGYGGPYGYGIGFGTLLLIILIVWILL